MPNLQDASLTQLASLASSDRIFVQRPGDNTDYYADVGDLPQPPASSGSAAKQNIDSFPGSTFTDKLENAIAAQVPFALNPGRQKLSRAIDVTNPRVDMVGAGDGHRMTGGTVLESAPGEDVFRFRYNGAVQSRPGGGNQITMAHFGLSLDPGGSNTRSSYQRCTSTGYSIGSCGIVYERQSWPTETTQARSISNSWNTSHSRLRDITCDVINGSSVDHGCGFFHSQGNSYGSRFYDLDSGGGQSTTRRGTHSLLSIAQPYVHRVTVDAGNNRINASSGNQFINGQQVMVRAHDATGSRPGGINFNTIYFVVNRTGSNFQLSTTSGGSPISISSSGSGFIYAILVGNAGGVFSPDEVKVDGVSHYNGKMGISICNPERIWIANITSYAIETILEIPAVVSISSRTQAVGGEIRSIYSQSPQSISGNANSEAVLVQADGMGIGYLQMRGADTGVQPIARFTGNNINISDFDGRSSFSQGGIDFRMQATGSQVVGQCHASSTVSVQSDTVGRLRQANGGGNFFTRNFQ